DLSPVGADGGWADEARGLPRRNQPGQLLRRFYAARSKNRLLPCRPAFVEEVLAREIDDGVRLLHAAREAGVRPVVRARAGRRTPADGEHLAAPGAGPVGK